MKKSGACAFETEFEASTEVLGVETAWSAIWLLWVSISFCFCAYFRCKNNPHVLFLLFLVVESRPARLSVLL